MLNGEQIKDNERRRFELMVVRLANHLNLSSADEFDALPGQVQSMFAGWKYIDVVGPLMVRDRDNDRLTIRQLEIKYGVPKSTISDYFKALR